jgi:hypothetical protein
MSEGGGGSSGVVSLKRWSCWRERHGAGPWVRHRAGSEPIRRVESGVWYRPGGPAAQTGGGAARVPMPVRYRCFFAKRNAAGSNSLSCCAVSRGAASE